LFGKARASPVAGLWPPAARSVTVPRPPQPRRRRRIGGEGGASPIDAVARVSASALIVDYIALCHDPMKDLRRWLAEDRQQRGMMAPEDGLRQAGQPMPPEGLRRAGRQFEATPVREGHQHANDAAQCFIANADRLCRQPLSKLQSGLDAHGNRGWSVDGVPARSTTGAERYAGLRSVSAEAGRGTRPDIAARGATSGLSAGRGGVSSGRGGKSLTGLPRVDSGGEQEAIQGLFAAKIEATRRSLPAHAVSAAIRALLDEQSAAMRAVTIRRQAAKGAARQGRAAARYSDRQARGPPRPRV